MDNYSSKVLGGLFGKNIGGTLGGPYEGNTSYLHLHYYDPIPTESLPNDDFEIQLVWLDMLKKKGIFIKPSDFTQHWQQHTMYFISEYFMGQRNMGLGLLPPVCGAFNNPWTIGMGCTIRAEIWAMIAPGMPDIAAAYAYMDASCDHTGEGMFGEMFIAAMESAAFVESDPNKLIDIGLSYIPADCGIREVVEFVRRARSKNTPIYQLRNLICAYYSHVCDFTYVLANVGFAMLGFLYGESFGDSLCSAVNCGYDTDCSGATLGAVLGIIAGREAIPDEWTLPIGSQVVVSDLVPGIEFAPTIEGVTSDICKLGEQIMSNPESVRKHLYEWTGLSFLNDKNITDIQIPSTQEFVLVSDDNLYVVADYVDGPFLGYGIEKELLLHITGKNTLPQELDIKINAPEGWTVTVNQPAEIIPAEDQTVCISVKIRADKNGSIKLRNDLFFNIAGTECRISLVGMKCWMVTDAIAADDCAAISDIESTRYLDPDKIAVEYQQSAVDDLFGFMPPAGYVRFIQTDFYCRQECNIEVLANNTGPVKAFLNGDLIIDKKHCSPGILPTWHLQNIPIHLLPRDMGFAKTSFVAGWNTVLFKLEGTNHPQDMNFHLVRILTDKIEDAGFSDYRPEHEITNTYWKDLPV